MTIGALATLALIGDMSIRKSVDNFMRRTPQVLVADCDNGYYFSHFQKRELEKLP